MIRRLALNYLCIWMMAILSYAATLWFLAHSRTPDPFAPVFFFWLTLSTGIVLSLLVTWTLLHERS